MLAGDQHSPCRLMFLGGTVKISISEHQPDTVVVFGEYADGSDYLELPTRETVAIYTGKQCPLCVITTIS